MITFSPDSCKYTCNRGFIYKHQQHIILIFLLWKAPPVHFSASVFPFFPPVGKLFYICSLLSWVSKGKGKDIKHQTCSYLLMRKWKQFVFSFLLKTAESKGELQTLLGQACITESQSQKKQVKQEALDIKESSSFSSRDANRYGGQVKKRSRQVQAKRENEGK